MHEVQYGNFLIHYNKNHAPKGSKQGGQFVSGDGDGDGIVDDHHNYSKNKSDIKSANKKGAVSHKTKISVKRRYELTNGSAKNVTEEEKEWLKKNKAQQKAVAFYLAAEATSAALASENAKKNGDYETAQFMSKYSSAAFDSALDATANTIKDSRAERKYN